MFGTLWSRVPELFNEAMRYWAILGPGLLLAVGIASMLDDGIAGTVWSLIGFIAVVVAYQLTIVRLVIGREALPGQRPTRSGLGGQQATVNDASALLFQAALALTIKELDGMDPVGRTADWFRSRMGENLSALADGKAETSAREAVEKVVVLSR